ncbi:MAG: GIY-YIG nuclease family protein [Candidatus Doudnabacteria bacterium]|nr:GIY-YIG nuclease family protein [Candidatus Doudnabacteria bacterium]
MYYVYVLRNPKGILYKGSTNNLERRVEQHKLGLYKNYTQKRGPWELVYHEV